MPVEPIIPQPEQANYISVGMRLPEPLWNATKKAAIDRGITAQQLVADALKRDLEAATAG